MVVVEQVVGSGRAGKVHRRCPLVIACLVLLVWMTFSLRVFGVINRVSNIWEIGHSFSINQSRIILGFFCTTLNMVAITAKSEAASATSPIPTTNTTLNGVDGPKEKEKDLQPQEKEEVTTAEEKDTKAYNSSNGVTSQLCTWIASLQLEDIPDSVRTRAKYLFLDGIACALVGARVPWSQKAFDAMAVFEEKGKHVVIGYEEVGLPFS